MIIGFIGLGQLLESRARGKTSEAIKRLIGLQSSVATRMIDGVATEVELSDLKVGDVVLARPGEKIAVDGSVGVVVNNSGDAYFWNPNEPEVCFEKLEAHKGQYVLKCRISPDKNMLATTSADHTVKLWDIKSRSLSKTLISHQRWVWDCTFSADSSYLVTCSSDHTARLWEIERGEVIRHYTGHHKAVICCALNDTSPA